MYIIIETIPPDKGCENCEKCKHKVLMTDLYEAEEMKVPDRKEDSDKERVPRGKFVQAPFDATFGNLADGTNTLTIRSKFPITLFKTIIRGRVQATSCNIDL